jgi:hypothetical protein
MGETILFALKPLFVIDVNLLSLFCVFRKEAFGTLDGNRVVYYSTPSV